MKLLTEDEAFNILEAADNTNKNRKNVEKYIYKFFDIIDPTGINTKMYKEKYSKMSDKEFKQHMDKFLNDDDQNFYLQSMAFENESHIRDIKAALDFMGVPTEEYVYFRNEGSKDKPIRTKAPVTVGYINVKRLRAKRSLRNLIDKMYQLLGLKGFNNLTI